MTASPTSRWLRIAIVFAVVYLVVGVAFPNPPVADNTQFAWRLAAWLTCGVAFATHIALEHFRLRNSTRQTALHVAAGVALGAFGLAAAANIHAMTAGTGSRRLLVLALVIWPIMTGVAAFVVAWLVATVLALARPNDRIGSN